MKYNSRNKAPVAGVLATADIAQHVTANYKGRAPVVDPVLAGRIIGMESLDSISATNLDQAISSFASIIADAVTKTGGPKLSLAQEEAACVGAVLGSNLRGYIGAPTHTVDALRAAAASQSNGITQVIPAFESAERMSLEAFDERANSNAMAFSSVYNLQAARQNPFGEAYYPTVVVTPEQVGFSVNIRLILTMGEVARSATGSLNNFNRKNIIRAIIDSSVLANDATKLIPVYRASGGLANTDKFAAGITPTTLTVDNAPLPTAPYAVNKKFSILGLCQTDANLAASQADQTDAVDSSVRLQAIYVKLTGVVATVPTTEYFKFDVENLPTSDFNAAVQGNTRLLTLRFTTKALKVATGQLTTAGAPSAILAAMSTNTARLSVTVTGEVQQQDGDTYVQPTAVGVEVVNDVSGQALSQTAGAGQTVANLLATAEVVGFDLLAYRTNSNRRNRGKQLDTQKVNFLYTLPLLPPVTALRPVTAQDNEDGNLLTTLVQATHVQTSNAAVTALLAARATLSQLASMDAEVVNNQPTIFGVASLMVTPAYTEGSIDCSTDLDSLTSNGRTADLQSLLINKVRDMAIRLFTQSGYGPALEVQYEGNPPKVTVIIGTDPIIASYFQLVGDTRLMGEFFDFKVVASYDERMAGKVIIGFGLESAFNSGVPNPLHFGCMGWKPELTLMLPMVRNGANIMELTVQPSFRHVTNVPVMGYLTVENIDLVVGGKVTVNTSV